MAIFFSLPPMPLTLNPVKFCKYTVVILLKKKVKKF